MNVQTVDDRDEITKINRKCYKEKKYGMKTFGTDLKLNL